MALSCGASAFAVETSSDCLSVLYVLTENKKIFAPESQIIEYVQAKTEEERAQALHKLKADPQNEVYEIRDGEIGIVPVDGAETGENFATPSSERTTGKWVLSDYEIGAGNTYSCRSGYSNQRTKRCSYHLLRSIFPRRRSCDFGKNIRQYYFES